MANNQLIQGLMVNLLSQNSFINGLAYILIAFVAVFLIVVIIKRLAVLYSRSLFRIDRMKGLEFEEFLKDLYTRLGYSVEMTKKSGDQGIDLIIKKHFKKIGIQVKRYSSAVGNFAVQEAVAGKRYYKLDRVCVITNGQFTRSAKELAKVNKVELIDRAGLKKLIKKAYRR